jgi:hypothetical protein
VLKLGRDVARIEMPRPCIFPSPLGYLSPISASGTSVVISVTALAAMRILIGARLVTSLMNWA